MQGELRPATEGRAAGESATGAEGVVGRDAHRVAETMLSPPSASSGKKRTISWNARVPLLPPTPTVWVAVEQAEDVRTVGVKSLICLIVVTQPCKLCVLVDWPKGRSAAVASSI